MTVIEVTSYSNELLENIQRFINQLSSSSKVITSEVLQKIILNDKTHLFVLTDGISFGGMLTICIYESPTGSKAWIEDVVIDLSLRGNGYGKIITQHAINFARSRKVDVILLTSRPSRLTANKLYQSLGFEIRDTNVYKLVL